MDNKICSKCKLFLPVSDFGKRSRSKDGLRSECKQCRKKLDLENQAITNLKRKLFRKLNSERLSATQQKYYRDHKEEKKEYDKIYYEANKDNIIDQHNKRNKIRRRESPTFRLRTIISSAVNKALKYNNSQKNISITKCLSYSFQELKQHLETQFEPWMSWDNYGSYNSKTWNDADPTTWTWQIDHIIPQSSLPYTSMEDENFKKCWSLENLRPYSAKQNLLDGVRRTRHKDV